MFWSTVARAQSFMPTQATEIAKHVDSLYAFLLISSFIACAILIGGMIYFVYRYRRQTDHDKTAYITHNTFLEFLWSFIPLVIFLAVFAWGWIIFHEMRTPPEGAREINVHAKQWSWEFEYKSGLKTYNELIVPVNTPIKLIMSSEDVLHSFYVPSFRIKQDVVPGRYTQLWFNSEKLGDFHVFCAEYCGLSHSNMLAKIKVVPKDEYEKWLTESYEEGELTIAQKGAKLYKAKACVGCHSTDGKVVIGPTFKGAMGSEKEMDDGSKVVVDENYLRESILQPTAKTVKGFPKGAMPSFQGQLSEEELSALIEFIKEQK